MRARAPADPLDHAPPGVAEQRSLSERLTRRVLRLGSTVNTASRMESQGVPGRIQVTETTYLRLRERFTFEKRGPITVKGKGELVTYFLLGREAKASPPS